MKLESLLQNQTVETINCGRKDYEEALRLQEKLREKRMNDQIQNTVLLLEHDPVYTIGKDNVDKNLLINKTLPEGVPLIYVRRGGKITYHGPGQLIGYFIFKVPINKVDEFINAIEDLTIATLNDYGIKAYSRKEETDEIYHKKIRGAWCSIDGIHKKIAAQGLEFKNAGKNIKTEEQTMVSMHGFALNVNTDISYFNYINPCGFQYDVMTSMEELLGETVPIEDVKRTIREKLDKGNNYSSELV